MEDDGKERRRAVRLEKVLEAILYSDRNIRFFITDLSATGMKGFTRMIIPADEQLKLKLFLGDMVEEEGQLVRTGAGVSLTARVVWQRKAGPSYSMGCEFLEVSDSLTEQLENFVRENLEAGAAEGTLEDSVET